MPILESLDYSIQQNITLYNFKRLDKGRLQQHNTVEVMKKPSNVRLNNAMSLLNTVV